MKKNLFILFILLTVLVDAENLGHRLGGDIYKPENTLYSYKKALKIQYKKKFSYIEFDVRESKDGELIVFHDKKINRIVPNSKYNRAILRTILKKKKFNRINLKDLKAKNISKLKLKNNAQIPTLKEVLLFSILHNVKKPIHIEIKKLDTDNARIKMIKLVAKFKKSLDITFISFSKNFYRSFPFPERWIKYFQKYYLKIYQLDKNEFTQRTISKRSFKVLLPQTSFHMSNKKSVKNFKITIPNNIKKNNYIKIGVYHGADDSGDKGLFLKVRDIKNKIIMSRFSKSKEWEWFTLTNISTKKLNITLEDYDTINTGRHPGNTAKLKIILIDNLD